MSGRKQHYIPQFLLRSFSEAGRGKKAQVRVITRDRTFIASTEGVAAQREFYSKLGEEGTLDDLITDAETEYAEIFQSLLALPDRALASPQQTARLLAHLMIRGGHIRDTLSAFGRYAIKRLTDLLADPRYMRGKFGLDLSEPNKEMRDRLDSIYNERRSQLVRVKMSRHDFRRWAFAEFKRKWDEIYLEMLPQILMMQSLVDIGTMATESHQKALSDSFEPRVRVETLAELEWSVRDFPVATLVLPDCVAIGHYDTIGAAPLVYVGNDEQHSALFPLSPTRALCTGSYGASSVLSTLTTQFPRFAALASWNFIVAPPSLDIGLSVGEHLGDAVVRMLFKTAEEAISEMIAEAMM